MEYWSNSKFADIIRGTKKPSALAWDEWDEWNDDAKAKNSIRYWIAEDGLSYAQDIVYFIPRKMNAIRNYISNRFITKTHCLVAHPSNIKPGTWCDVGNRFLPCLFNELVDFVEIELAWMHCAFDDEARKKYNIPKRFYSFKKWRNPEAGLDYLAWAKELTNKEYCPEGETPQLTLQALSSIEIEKLYKWWKFERPLRLDPYDESKWSEIVASNGGGISNMLKNISSDESKQSLTILQELENKYDDEDEAMMIRLIKVRNHLWT